MRDKWFGGGRADYGRVAADAFGNSLVDYVVGQLKEGASKESTKYKYQEDQGHEIAAEVLSNEAVYERYGYTVASTGDVSMGDGQGAAGVDLEIEALVEARLSGWFGVLSSLGDDESFIYASPSRYSDVPTLDGVPNTYYLPSGVQSEASKELGFFDKVKGYYNEKALIPLFDWNDSTAHNVVASMGNFYLVGVNSLPLLYGAADDTLNWAGFGGVDRVLSGFPGGGTPKLVIKTETALVQHASAVGGARQGSSLWRGVP